MATPTGFLSIEQLSAHVAADEIDTVIIALTDMQGRLTGKRTSARLFLEELAEHGAECCNYLLAVDVDMNTVSGYAMSSWERGYGDMVMKPDLSTLRAAPWLEKTAIVTVDLEWPDGTAVVESPRAILRRQLDRLHAKGLEAFVGTELEFMVFDDSYRDAWKKGYRELTPATDFNVDYALAASTRLEPLLHDIRVAMDGAGMYCEGVKGECNLGQQEIAFRFRDALGTCDNHSIYKSGAKEIAAAHGQSLTFMAKFNEREGNSCHIHISLRSLSGEAVFADETGTDSHGMSKLFRHFVAGQIAATRELSLFYAPNINSYKRYQVGSFAPTSIAWGLDNRTCALRVVGHGSSMRVESRVPGGDVNQYLAVAALIAAGLHGIENELELPEAYDGNAYDDAAVEKVPGTLREAAELFAGSAIAREAFGETIVAHYLNNAAVELAAFEATVTDWERVRGFERL